MFRTIIAVFALLVLSGCSTHSHTGRCRHAVVGTTYYWQGSAQVAPSRPRVIVLTNQSRSGWTNRTFQRSGCTNLNPNVCTTQIRR